jgi:hypothetical protein
MKIIKCKHCSYVGNVDYYNQINKKETWIIKNVGITHDLLKCPKCGNQMAIEAK